MAWLALTVKLDAAAAEVLSEALLEAGAHSVAIDTPCASRHTLTALIAADADPAAMLGRASKQTWLGRVPAFNVARIDDQDWVRRSLFLPLIVLAPLLAARTSRGGKIALAGILEAQARELAATYACWFEIDTVALLDGWALLAGVRR